MNATHHMPQEATPACEFCASDEPAVARCNCGAWFCDDPDHGIVPTLDDDWYPQCADCTRKAAA